MHSLRPQQFWTIVTFLLLFCFSAGIPETNADEKKSTKDKDRQEVEKFVISKITGKQEFFEKATNQRYTDVYSNVLFRNGSLEFKSDMSGSVEIVRIPLQMISPNRITVSKWKRWDDYYFTLYLHTSFDKKVIHTRFPKTRVSKENSFMGNRGRIGFTDRQSAMQVAKSLQYLVKAYGGRSEPFEKDERIKYTVSDSVDADNSSFKVGEIVGAGNGFLARNIGDTYWRGRILSVKDGNYRIKIIEIGNSEKAYKIGETYDFSDSEIESRYVLK